MPVRPLFPIPGKYKLLYEYWKKREKYAIPLEKNLINPQRKMCFQGNKIYDACAGLSEQRYEAFTLLYEY